MEYINLKNEKWEKKSLDKIAKIIKNGGITIIPTDTVYGIATNAQNEEAVKKIYDLKKREPQKPMSILVSSIEMIEKVANEITEKEKKIMECFFPGAITIILKKNKSVPSIVTAGLDTIGVRMPDNKIVLELIEKIKVPIIATSCNLAGEKAATDIDQISYEIKNGVDYVLDDGKSKIAIPSTIVKVEKEQIKILREGSIKKEDIERKIENG